MAGALAHVKQEWQKFKTDQPGERFGNHRERMKDRSRALTIASVALGVALLLGGVVLLFIPGPGLLLMVFGLALVASQSKRLADALDRIEPKLRRGGRRVKRWWKRQPGQAKISVILGLGIIGAVGLMLVWRVAGAYLLGLI